MKLHKIYTGMGNNGATSLMYTDEKVSKGHILIETNQYINLYKLKLGFLLKDRDVFYSWIKQLQSHLNMIMGMVVSSKSNRTFNKYVENFNPNVEQYIEDNEKFLNLIKTLDIEIDGWVEYNDEKSLPYFECSEYCRIAEINLAKAKNQGYYIQHNLFQYFNLTNKILFMMGYMIHNNSLHNIIESDKCDKLFDEIKNSL